MGHEATTRTNEKVFKNHLILAAILVACALVLVHWLSAWEAIGSAVAAFAAVHAVSAVVVHTGLALTGGGLLMRIVRQHGRANHERGDVLGATLHSPRFYDWLAVLYCLGREPRMRERTLGVAGVAAGERVLDVGCGTGTLALAAKRRVGANGSVHGVDASQEMIARAQTKTARSGLLVEFKVGAAQALPFPDAQFDVVLCTLALHHLPEDARVAAIGEMHRVIKPGGRVLIVEFGKRQRVLALLHPVAFLHAHKTRQVLDGALELMKRAGFGRIVTGELGFAGLRYALGHLR
jgi:ubiquinone/menaquinone biosynthesis C-methylase UbiE